MQRLYELVCVACRYSRKTEFQHQHQHQAYHFESPTDTLCTGLFKNFVRPFSTILTIAPLTTPSLPLINLSTTATFQNPRFTRSSNTNTTSPKSTTTSLVLFLPLWYSLRSAKYSRLQRVQKCSLNLPKNLYLLRCPSTSSASSSSTFWEIEVGSQR